MVPLDRISIEACYDLNGVFLEVNCIAPDVVDIKQYVATSLLCNLIDEFQFAHGRPLVSHVAADIFEEDW